jgi:hypothetical protein
MHPDAPARRITTWLAILGYAFVASGLPLPLGSSPAPVARDAAAARRIAAKDRSRPFPCMDKACGCDTAERCFTSCCCHTPAETLAWAKARGVEPAVLSALENRMRLPRLDAVQLKSACCSTSEARAKATCCATATDIDSPAAPDACCEEDRVVAAAPAAGTDIPAAAQPRTRSLVLRAMLACGGIAAEWLATGAALPPPRAEVSLAMRVLDTTAPADEAGECLRAAPAAPPPRAA